MTKEERKIYNREYRLAHKDKIAQYNKKYYEKNLKNNPETKVKRAEYQANWQKINREKWNAYLREYRRKKKLENKLGGVYDDSKTNA